MNENTLKLRLEQICHEHQVDRFQPDEIWEMLSDGEDVEWMVGMLTENKPTASEPLKEILLEISELVRPALALPEPVAPGAEVIQEVEPEAAQEAPVSPVVEIELPPDASDAQMQELLNSPYGFIMGDFLQFCQERGIDISNMQNNQKALKPYLNQWMAEPRASFNGKTPGAMIEENPEMMYPEKVETIRRVQPKVGRNDPCTCGSGKKYKKCCGREE